MSDDIVKRARDLLAAATPGPWKWDAYLGWLDAPETNILICNEGDGPFATNASLIAAAPELIAKLADEIEWLRSEATRAAVSRNS